MENKNSISLEKYNLTQFKVESQFKCNSWVYKRTQWIKLLATKSEDLSLEPRST